MIPIPLERPNLPKGASADGVPMATVADLLGLRRELDKFVQNSVSLRLFGVSADEAATETASDLTSRIATAEAKIVLNEAAIAGLASAEGLAFPGLDQFRFDDGAAAGEPRAILSSWINLPPARLQQDWGGGVSINGQTALKFRKNHILTMSHTGFNCRDGWNISARHIIEAGGTKVPVPRFVMFEGHANMKLRNGSSIVVENASYSVWAESSDLSKFVTEDGLCTVPPVFIEPIIGQWPYTDYGYVAGGAGDPAFTGGGALDIASAGGFRSAWTVDPKHRAVASEPGPKMAAILRAMFSPHTVENTYYPAPRELNRDLSGSAAGNAYRGVLSIDQRTPALTLSILSIR